MRATMLWFVLAALLVSGLTAAVVNGANAPREATADELPPLPVLSVREIFPH